MYQNVVCLIFAILVSLGAVGAFVLTGISAFRGSGRNTVRAWGILGGGLTGLAVLLWLGWTGVLLQGRMRFGPWFYPALGITILMVAALAYAIVISVRRRGAWRIVRGWLLATLGITATIFAWCGFAGVWHPERKGWLFYLGIIGIIASVLLLAWALYESIWARRHRVVSWILLGIAGVATLFLWLGANGVFSAGPSDGPVEPTGSPEPTVSEPPETLVFPRVNLTDDQITEFLADYDDKYDNSTLASRVDERRDAIRKVLGETWDDAPDFPNQLALDHIDELRDWKNLPVEKQEELEELFVHQRNQKTIADPATLYEQTQMLSELPAAMANNGDIIQGILDKFDAWYAVTPEEAEAGKLVGIDNALEYRSISDKTIYVKPEVQKDAVKICAILEFMHLEGTTTRTTAHNWHMLPVAEDSRTIIVENTVYQESRESLLWVFGGKEYGIEISATGSNICDQRVVIYEPNQPEPEHTDPPVVTTDPPAQPSQPITTPPPTVNYYNVYTRWVDIDTGETLKDWFLSHSNVANGASYTVTAGQLTGFTAKKISIEGVGEWWLPSVSDTIHGHDARVTVFYDRNAYNLYYECGYYGMNGGWNVLQSKTYAGTYEYEQAYTVHAPNFLPSYKLISATPATGKMPAQDYTIYFVYSPVDGQGAKNPQDDPVYQSNAPIGGGPNLPTDGTGTAQPTEPPRQDYPPTASQNPVINTPPSAPPDQNGGYTDENRPINSAPPVVDNGLGGETSGGMVTGP